MPPTVDDSWELDSSEPRVAAALLGRPPLPTDWTTAEAALADRRVLVTGAGGSVGKALADRLLSFDCESVTLLDHHDHALFALRKSVQAHPRGERARLILADIRDRSRTRRILGELRPHAIFHLAAYKHVPFGEEFPEEAYAVNVAATVSLIARARELDVQTFAYPSSDKAVNPPSIYGATKRLSEVAMQRAAKETGRPYVVARYVNILGTHGSVVETFRDQVRRGQALTVTDERMTRYWASMSEAVWLIAHAAARGEPGAVMMLDAREEIPVVTMARRVEALVAPRQTPLPLAITGARPGERLREELLSANEWFEPGPLPGLLEVRTRRPESRVGTLTDVLNRLDILIEREDTASFRDLLMDAARSLQ
ncbi:MAG: polysaccharide biosynthesis protein [Chloroflexota bacterium]